MSVESGEDRYTQIVTAANDELDDDRASATAEDALAIERGCIRALERNYGDTASVTATEAAGCDPSGTKSHRAGAIFAAAHRHSVPVGSIEVLYRQSGTGGDRWIISYQHDTSPAPKQERSA